MLSAPLSQPVIELLITAAPPIGIRQPIEHIQPFFIQLIDLPRCDHRAPAEPIDDPRMMDCQQPRMVGGLIARHQHQRVI